MEVTAGRQGQRVWGWKSLLEDKVQIQEWKSLEDGKVRDSGDGSPCRMARSRSLRMEVPGGGQGHGFWRWKSLEAGKIQGVEVLEEGKFRDSGDGNPCKMARSRSLRTEVP